MMQTSILILGWLCLLLWMVADVSNLPPVIRAFQRGKLVKGENPYPWVQSFTAAIIRASYLYHQDSKSPLDIRIGTMMSLGCCTFVSLVAVGISSGAKCGKLCGSMWLGIMVSVLISWLCSQAVAGICYIVVIAVNRASLWVKIPHAIRVREGRYFCDGYMLWSTLVMSSLYAFYAYAIDDLYLCISNIVSMLFVIPCVLLKLVLHPRFYGKATSTLHANNYGKEEVFCEQSNNSNWHFEDEECSEGNGDKRKRILIEACTRKVPPPKCSTTNTLELEQFDQRSFNEGEGENVIEASVASPKDIRDSKPLVNGGGKIHYEEHRSKAIPQEAKEQMDFPDFVQIEDGEDGEGVNSITVLLPAGSVSSSTISPLPVDFFDDPSLVS